MFRFIVNIYLSSHRWYR